MHVPAPARRSSPVLSAASPALRSRLLSLLTPAPLAWLVFIFLPPLLVPDSQAQTSSFTYLSSFTDVGRPTGLALDTIDNVTYLYVSDHDGGRVFRFNLTDGTRTQIASTGTANGQFLQPDAIAIEPTTHDLYIADRQLHRITRLTRDGAFVMKFGDTGTQTNRFGHTGAGTANGQFNGPVGIAIDSAGFLYTTEHENHRVQKFRVTRTATGWSTEHIATWGNIGTGPGEFGVPYGIAVDSAGSIWVADGYNSRLQKFSPTGQLLGQISVRAPGEPQLINTWVTFDAAGALWVGITSDPHTGGNIANQRIEKFSPAGASLGRWGSYGRGPGQFSLPFGIVIHDATNRAYVTDYDNNRVQVFSLGTPTTPPPTPPPPTPPTTPPVTPPPVPAARLINLSSRQRIASTDTMRGAIAGFVIGGNAPRQVLVRAVGPGLSAFGVTDALANPRLQILDATSRPVAENDDWSANTDLTNATERAGAFRLASGSRDAAVLTSLAPGAYTAHVTASTGSGVTLLEVYDVATTPPAPSDKLLNLSTRGFVDSGEAQLVAGFVVTGEAPKRLLIRGVGPALTGFGVTGTLADPTLKLYASGQAVPIAENDNWGTTQPAAPGSLHVPASAVEIATAATAAGAFALPAASRDAALLVTLAPGNYTAVVGSATNAPGVGLVEVFELPAP